MDSILFPFGCLAVAVLFIVVFYTVEVLTRRYDERQYRRAVSAKEHRVSVSR